MKDQDVCQRLIDSGDFEIAYNVCMAAIETKSDDHLAWHMLSRLSRRMGYSQEAVDFSRKSLELDVGNPAYIQELAICLIESGLCEALQELLDSQMLNLPRQAFESVIQNVLNNFSVDVDGWLAGAAEKYYMASMGVKCLGKFQVVSVVDAISANEITELAGEFSWPVSPIYLEGFSKTNYEKIYTQRSYPQYMATFSDVLLVSGLDAIIDKNNKEIVSDELYNNFDVLGREFFYQKQLTLFSSYDVFCLANCQDEVVIENAISFFGSCNYNYAHWIFEKLPRFYWLDNADVKKNFYVLVEVGLPDSVMCSLELLWPSWMIIKVEPGRRVKVKNLIHISNSIEFFEPYHGYEFTGNEFRLYPHAYPWLAEKMKQMALDVSFNDIGIGRNLYLPRKAGAPRSIVNQEELMSKLQGVGVEYFDTADLGFLCQVNAFSKANVIIGASGAAFANLLFLPRGAVCIIICNDTQQMPMWFFYSVAQAVGVRVIFYAGVQKEDDAFIEMHRSVECPVNDVVEFSRQFLYEFSRMQGMAFLVHHELLLDHFIPIWKLMGENSFSVILAGDEEENVKIMEKIDGQYGEVISLDNALSKNRRFNYLISNHPLDPSGDFPVIKKLAGVNIRFMYAAGKTGWNLSAWNALYNAALVMGPAQMASLSKFKELVLLPMGWPRMDSYFNDSWNVSDLQAEFNCRSDRKTIVWLPTWTEISSVKFYAKSIASLSNNYNVLVKLHPLHKKHAPEDIALLENLEFSAVISEDENNVKLIKLADWVFADYGGSPFAALYSGKPLLLLDVPGADEHETIGFDSPDVNLRNTLIHIDPDRVNDIGNLLQDEVLWKEQAVLAASISNQYVYPFRGTAGYLASTYLSNIGSIIR